MILASLSECATRKGKVAAMGGDEAEEKSFSVVVDITNPVPFVCCSGAGFSWRCSSVG